MQISLFTSITYARPHSSTEKALSTLSHYFYLGGKQATVVKGNEVQLKDGKVSWLKIALKVASYVLLFPLTLILFAAHLTLRSLYSFTVMTSPSSSVSPQKASPSQTPQPLPASSPHSPTSSVPTPQPLPAANLHLTPIAVPTPSDPIEKLNYLTEVLKQAFATNRGKPSFPTTTALLAKYQLFITDLVIEITCSNSKAEDGFKQHDSIRRFVNLNKPTIVNNKIIVLQERKDAITKCFQALAEKCVNFQKETHDNLIDENLGAFKTFVESDPLQLQQMKSLPASPSLLSIQESETSWKDLAQKYRSLEEKIQKVKEGIDQVMRNLR